MEQINTICLDMPTTIKAYTVCNADDTYTIILNSKLCHEQLYKSYQHEFSHIQNGDYEKGCNIDILEFYTHNHKN